MLCLFRQKVALQILHSLGELLLEAESPCLVGVQHILVVASLALEIADWDRFPVAEVAGTLMALIHETVQLHC